MAVSELKIKEFLADGDGSGSGNGYGYGDGYGSGDGFGDGVKSINGMTVYKVDSVPTVFTSVHGNIAKGMILGRGLKLSSCFIVKGHGYFAHGETLKEAQTALESKIVDNMDIEEKIAEFKKQFNVTDRYPVRNFYDWHNKLTGSCEMGRKAFADSRGIDIDNDFMTVAEFIKITKDSYGGEVIRLLEESYGEERE